MWFQLCVGIVLLQVLNVNLIKQRKTIKTTNEDTEAIFADVIKNISRVNSVLQDLINNYEHLQKIYQSQENLESLTPIDEIDEVFKTKKEKERKNGQERSKSELTTSTTYDGNPATQIIWSADEGRSDNSEVISSEGNNSNDVVKTDDEKDTEKPNIVPKNTNNNRSSSNKEKKADPVNIKKIPKGSQDSNLIFIGTHKSANKNKHIREKPSLEPVVDIMLHDATTTKFLGSNKGETRYSKVSQSRVDVPRINEEYKSVTVSDEYFKTTDDSREEQSQELDRTKATTTTKRKKEATKAVQKKLHLETFSKENFWDGIINNKPIQLESYSDFAFENMRKDGDDLKSLKRDLKHSIEKETPAEKQTAPIVVARQNQISNNKSNSSEKDDGSEELQANLLRKAYGDACLKVVIKKCYKACRSAGKEVCSKFKCKEEYKQMFDKNVRSGCIMEFDVNAGGMGKNIRDWEDVFYRSRNDKIKFGIQNRTDDGEHDARFKNSTSSWYMQSCLPLIETGSRRPSGASAIITKESPKLVQQSTDLNILRDRFEKECQKASKDKCNKACTFASDKVCESYTCKKDRRNSYKKSCRKKCKNTYGSAYSSDSSVSTSKSGSSDSSYSSDTSSSS